MTITLGVSLKAYLGYQQTVSWAAGVAEVIAGHRPDLELFVLPSYPALAEVSRILAGTGVGLGAQNLAADDSGAQTGEVTGAMLVELGCRYVTVGHAERRSRFGESDDVVAAKIAAAFRHGLTPVLCVGETDHRTATAGDLGVRPAARFRPHCGPRHRHCRTRRGGLRAGLGDRPGQAGTRGAHPRCDRGDPRGRRRFLGDLRRKCATWPAEPTRRWRRRTVPRPLRARPTGTGRGARGGRGFDGERGPGSAVTIGLGTYAFFWQWHQTAETPLSLIDMVDRTADLRGGALPDLRLPAARVLRLDVSLIGCTSPRHRTRASRWSSARAASARRTCGATCELAERLDATLVRSMINTADHRPSPDEAVELLRSVAPAFEAAGVTLALETYEQVPVDDLVDIVDPRRLAQRSASASTPAIASPRSSYPPRPWRPSRPTSRNIHVKDFAFSRRDGWVGFTFAGCPLGEGLLDYHAPDHHDPCPRAGSSARSSSTGCRGRATAPAPSAPKTTGPCTTLTI